MTQSFVTAFAARAAAAPSVPALIWENQAIGYGELYAMACRARAQVTAAALDTEGPVGLRVRKSPEAVALVLGCLMAGRSFLLPSHELPDIPLKELYHQAGCRQIFGTVDGPMIDAVVHPAAGWTGAAPQQEQPAPVDPDAIGFMLTTSGSTGVPKIVPISYGAVTRFAAWAAETFGITNGTRVLNYAPLNFDLCLLDVWSTLAYGGTVVMVDPDRGTSETYLRELVTGHGVQVVQGVPLLFQLLVEAAGGEPLDGPEHLVFAGESFPARLLDDLAPVFPEARWYNNYGCTETNNSFLHEVDRDGPVTAPLPIGRPLPGVNWLLVDGDGRALTGPGQGELLVNTPFQTTGYLNSPNEEKFGPHPDGDPGLLYYRSGDIATRHEDGSLSVLGRRDFLVKVRGFQVSTQSVEGILLDHPAVAEAAVVALPDPVAGHRLHAQLRLTEPGSVGVLTLRQYCAQRTVRAAVPAVFELVTTALPRTSTGKVDRTRIKQSLLEQ
ncbi:Fatty acid-CoA ligase [Streptomyces davaonensis JCM 4913]|uniref:Fatty acid-CoA ligase n=1 Tax=Streptomyces davaonensis (strain DSM 101723 / JCM 4913 / KCC S-0913 / 768) TaxID=1214101 RepID=K4RC75_STRDJ|nr:AMP-binding protein [Streptomyces davaonensis]CCK30439.1 Fatty acid-CoA ligase [Streptomyces davaonensis JCM 4913]